MDISTLLADPTAIVLELLVSEPNSITLVVRAAQPRPRGPKCHQPSTSLHSHYQRTIADLPWHGVAVRLPLHTHKFRCRNDLCSQKVFCQRLPDVAAVYARKTVRLTAALRLLAFALGGEAGARAANGLGLATSGDTPLRRIRQTPLPEAPPPKALGVEDWAKRKGQSYGTILIDLERRRPIDLLPDREADTLAAWLAAHPGVEVIARDRAGAYADGARRGAPAAVQVADRFHLPENISEVLEKLLHRNYKAVKAALRQSVSQAEESPTATPTPTDEDAAAEGETSAVDSVAPRSQQYHAERRATYELVQEMKRQGLNINQIRLQIKRHHSTVTRFFHAEGYPVTTRRRGSRLAARFMDYLQKRWLEGCHNARRLFQELNDGHIL